MNRGILQVIYKESGETLFETETTIKGLKESMFNFDLCDYQFITDSSHNILNTGEIKALVDNQE